MAPLIRAPGVNGMLALRREKEMTDQPSNVHERNLCSSLDSLRAEMRLIIDSFERRRHPSGIQHCGSDVKKHGCHSILSRD
jgi:hypothetical protein